MKLLKNEITINDFKQYKRLLNSAIWQAKSLYFLKKFLRKLKT